MSKQLLSKVNQLSKSVSVNKQLEEKIQQIVSLRAQLAEKEKTLNTYRKGTGWMKDLLREVRESVVALDPIKQAKLIQPKKSASTTPIWATMLDSDWQIGEVINANETEGFGTFDWETAQRRVHFLEERQLEWVNIHRHGYNIETGAIVGIGDWVSGDIHYELQVTNEFPLPVQTARAGQLWGDRIAAQSQHFKTLHVFSNEADNHGRLVKKPQSKQKVKNNMSYLVAEIAQERTKNLSNVIWHRFDGMKTLVSINGIPVLVLHGDGIKGQMGIPFYGFERMVAREALKRMGTEKHFKYVFMGHWHVPNKLGKIYINGSLTGTTEYDHNEGRHAEPAQVSMFMHPKHGIFDWTPWQLK
jgi:hypothetical protein